MTTVAFVKKETGLAPCHPNTIKRGDEFFLVVDGVQSEFKLALKDAHTICDAYTYLPIDWKIESTDLIAESKGSI